MEEVKLDALYAAWRPMFAGVVHAVPAADHAS
jgi:hypothetical protein